MNVLQSNLTSFGCMNAEDRLIEFETIRSFSTKSLVNDDFLPVVNKELISYINSMTDKLLLSRNYNISNCNLFVNYSSFFSLSYMFSKTHEHYEVDITNCNDVEKNFFEHCEKLQNAFEYYVAVLVASEDKDINEMFEKLQN